MTYLIANVPEVDILKERLKDTHWVNYYARFDSFQGDSKGIEYLLKFLKIKFASMIDSSYY